MKCDMCDQDQSLWFEVFTVAAAGNSAAQLSHRRDLRLFTLCLDCLKAGLRQGFFESAKTAARAR